MDNVRNLKWDLILYSVTCVILGVLMVVFPGKIVDALGIVIGCSFFLLAIKNLIEYFNKITAVNHHKYKLVTAVIYGLLGVYVILRMSAILSFLTYVIAVVIVIRGIMKVEEAFDLKRLNRKWVPMLVVALITVALGFLVLSLPMNRNDDGTYVAGDTLISTLGIILTLNGIIDFITTLAVSSKLKVLLKDNDFKETNGRGKGNSEEIIIEDAKEVK